MPHRRSPQKLLEKRERYHNYLQNIPRYEVASSFSAKNIHAVNVTSDNNIVMKHMRKAVGACELCGSKRNLNVHHKDKNHQNNSTNNLMVLCRSCHVNLHLEEKKYAL